MSKKAKSLAYEDTIYSADSIEWCPFEGYQDVFVCGTYQVLEPNAGKSSKTDGSVSGTEVDASADSEEEEEEDGGRRQTQRTGRLLVYQVEEEGDSVSLKEVQRIETAAILDSKWCPQTTTSGQPVLAVGDAKGSISLYELDSSKYLIHKDKLHVDEDTTLCLSLDWSHRFPSSPRDESGHSPPSSIMTSLSTGSLSHLVPTESGWSVENKWAAHEYEPWITAFDQWNPNVVWSGGDDCKLKSWDLRDTSNTAFVNKNFDAGVTTITPSAHTPHLLAVGSYDSNLRIFDSRNARSPLLTVPVAGGIWRTRFHPSPERKGDILLACMHGGCSVIRLDGALDSLEDALNFQAEIAAFDEHSSLAYGADWSRLPPTNLSLIASCSFYDHAMHLWRA